MSTRSSATTLKAAKIAAVAMEVAITIAESRPSSCPGFGWIPYITLKTVEHIGFNPMTAGVGAEHWALGEHKTQTQT